MHVIILSAIAVISVFLTLFGLWYKIDRDTNTKIDNMGKAFADQLADAIQAGDAKRTRIYERLDEVKTEHREDLERFRRELTDEYVPLKMCSLVHDNQDKSYNELKETVKELKESVKEVDRKVDVIVAKVG